MSRKASQTVSLTVDGRRVSAQAGSYLLPLIRGMGIELPTLCDHPDLEPVAACRLCMVEVTHPDWNGWSGLMTACLYPAAEGIEVSTRSERVIEARRGVLALLAARCPGSQTIQALARRHGVNLEQSRLFSDPAADDCILCGLCTRVCETYATGAISTVSRGATKRVAPFADTPPEECVGCGACALVCPTGRIAQQRRAGSYTIWDRTIEVSTAVVDPQRCVGCGACEEACPFSVARVTLQRGGLRMALIPAEHCRGCGACVGACPSGAIDQPPSHDFATLTRGIAAQPAESLVLACSRSDLGRTELPAGTRLLELPCAGRVSLPLLLWALCGHTRGVLVLGRHQQTCRFNGAEDPARRRVDQARILLAALGLSPERIQMVEPEPGRDGPLRAVTRFAEQVAALGPLPYAAVAPPDLLTAEGLDSAMALIDWLGQQLDAPALECWLDRAGLPAAAPGAPALVVPDLLQLLALDPELLRPEDLADQLSASLAVLTHLGHPGAGIATRENGGQSFDPAQLLQLLNEQAGSLPRPPQPLKVACDAGRHGALVTALGHQPVDLGADPLPSSFALSPGLRSTAEERLRQAEAAGALLLLLDTPRDLARWALVTREGTWRSSRVRPVLGAQLAHLALLGQPAVKEVA